ncbi:hypothetical protein CCR75_008530 [Bremia lactucae]|uniref:Glutathione transferase n=1 Tax=Bremia lactucae TaxID=4779 RepID=A0A976IDB3_BRELC|nr:hypothetical protein CCR75_008530 [Bremia lactucae]
MCAFPSIKLTYFNIAGAAEASRLAFYIGNVPFEDKRLSKAEFASVKETLPLGQVPVLEVDEEVFTQSHAILRYAGRLGGLYPVSAPYFALKIDELLHAMGEIEAMMVVSYHETNVEKKKALREELATDIIPRYAKIFEARLSKMQQIAAFQTEKVFIHDVAIYSWIKPIRAGNIDDIPCTVFDGYKLLNEAFNKVANHPKVTEWYTIQHCTPKLKLTYMPKPGRAEPIRLAFFIGGVEFEDERITREEMLARKPSLPFNQLPVLEVDGEVIAQSLAILRYAGTLTGLYPVTHSIMAYRVDELLAILDELCNCPLWGACFREKDAKKQLSMRATLVSGALAKALSGFDKIIKRNKGPYAAGPKLTVADLAIYGLLLTFKNGMAGVETNVADNFENLQRVFKLVAEHPKVVEWNASHGL